MLTIKNLVRKKTCIFLTLAALLAGCTPPGPKALLDGKRLLEQGRYTLAVEKLKIATSLLSTNALAWDYLGLACHYAGSPVEAERAYQRALFCDRDLVEAHYNLGSLWMEENKLDGARLELTAFTLRRGNSLPGLLKLGTVQLRLRDPNGAEKSFGEALRLSPQNVEALNGLGLARVERGRFTEAVARFNEALKWHPGCAPALLNLAVVSHLYLRDHPAALQKYREYLALSPPPPNAPAVAALVQQLEAELNPPPHLPVAPPPVTAETAGSAPHHPISLPSPATNIARNVVSPKIEPATNATKPIVVATNTPKPVLPIPTTKPAPTLVTPSTSTLTSKPAVAVAAKPVTQPAPPPSPLATAPAPVTASFTQTVAITAPPVSAPAPTPVTEASKQADAFSRTAGPVSHTASFSPPPPPPGNRAESQAALARGEAAQGAGRLDEAIRAYEAAIAADPSFFEAHYNLGVVATDAGRTSQALSAYESALALRPDSANARYNLALVLKQANFPAGAIRELDKLLAQYPDEVRAHLAMANIYARTLNQPDKARPHYQRVLEIDPHDPQAAGIREWLKANPSR